MNAAPRHHRLLATLTLLAAAPTFSACTSGTTAPQESSDTAGTTPMAAQPLAPAASASMPASLSPEQLKAELERLKQLPDATELGKSHDAPSKHSPLDALAQRSFSFPLKLKQGLAIYMRIDCRGEASLSAEIGVKASGDQAVASGQGSCATGGIEFGGTIARGDAGTVKVSVDPDTPYRIIVWQAQPQRG